MEVNVVDTFDVSQIEEVTLTDTDNSSYRVTVKYSSDNGIPVEGTKLLVEVIDDGSELYSDAIRENESNLRLSSDFADFITLLDIKIVDAENEEVEFQPTGDVDVNIQILDRDIRQFDSVEVVHISNDGESFDGEVVDKTSDETGINFSTDGFSIYAITGYNVIKEVKASDGNTYTVSLSFNKNSGLGKDISLRVHEILPETDDFNAYSLICNDVTQFDISYLRLFDISILDSDGNDIEPEGEVSLNISLNDMSQRVNDISVIHFGDNVEVHNIDGNNISFKTDSFSVYAVVAGPEPLEIDTLRVTSLSQLASLAPTTDIYIAHISGVYFTGTQYVVKDSRTGILKTGVSSSIPVAVSKNAVPYHFAAVSGQTNVYKIYTKEANGITKYIKQNTNSLLFTYDENDATAFTVEDFPGEANTFRVRGSNDYCFNQQGNASGKGFAAFNSLTDVNAKMMFMYLDEIDDDPFGLDGKSYGIVNPRSETTVAAMLGEEKTVNGHTGLSLRNLISKVNTMDVNTQLYVDNNNSISF